MARSRRRPIEAVGAAALFVVTVAVFVSLDRVSHSASDTLRPFLIIMIPVWVIAVATARRIRNREKHRHPN